MVTAPRRPIRIAIVGTGIAGNVVAHRLNCDYDITVFEAANHVGGHTNTIDVEEEGGSVPVDTGFIVFNDRTYPNFVSLLDELGQSYRPSVMSFSVRNQGTGLEYCGSSINGLFAQRRNVLSTGFHRMIRDILRFNTDAVLATERLPADATVGDYLAEGGYSNRFRDDYLVPMTAAIWSAEPGAVSDMPLHFLVRFFRNHGLLQLSDRPQWRVITGGSREYVRKLVAGHRHCIRLSCPVESISRLGNQVQVKARGCEPQRFDYVFVACHSDQALKILADPTAVERSVLGAIRYQRNEAVLHTDASLMPTARRAWAAWNYRVPAAGHEAVSVTYNMNILQGLQSQRDYLVTLNGSSGIEPSRILETVTYEHPVFTTETMAAQRRHAEINSGNRTFFCGAYWRNGFHEDGVVSALDALQHFNEELRRGELHLRRAG